LKDWYYFEEGSWWIYRLAEDTTQYDTVSVVYRSDYYSNRFCESEFAPAKICSEVLQLTLQHSNAYYYPLPQDSTKPNIDIISGYYPHGFGQFLSMKRIKSRGIFFALPIVEGESFDEYTMKDSFTTWNLNGTEYSHVVHSVTNVPTNLEYTTDIWWGKGVGMLKIIKSPGLRPRTTWELIEYHIEK